MNCYWLNWEISGTSDIYKKKKKSVSSTINTISSVHKPLKPDQQETVSLSVTLSIMKDTKPLSGSNMTKITDQNNLSSHSRARGGHFFFSSLVEHSTAPRSVSVKEKRHESSVCACLYVKPMSAQLKDAMSSFPMRQAAVAAGAAPQR